MPQYDSGFQRRQPSHVKASHRNARGQVFTLRFYPEAVAGQHVIIEGAPLTVEAVRALDEISGWHHCLILICRRSFTVPCLTRSSTGKTDSPSRDSHRPTTL